MKKTTRKPFNLFLVVIFFSCTLLAMSSAKFGLLKNSGFKKQVSFSIQSRISNIKILEATIGDTIRVTFKNDSPKNITAFSIDFGGTIVRTESLGTTEVIPPKSTFFRETEITQFIHKYILFLAVVYEDGTTDGEFKFIKQILDARAGQEAQLQRILPILQGSLIATQNLNSKEKWQINVDKIKSLPDHKEGGSFEYNAALQDEKNLALLKVEEFERFEQERGAGVAHQMLSHLMEQYERKQIVWQSAVRGRR